MTRRPLGAGARALAAWLPAALLVPAGLAAAVQVTEPDPGPAAALTGLHPLDTGTTWVYRVLDHGEPSGTRTRQVAARAGIDAEHLDAVTVTSRYTDYPGTGERSDLTYLGVGDDALLQFGVVQDGDHVEIEPDLPAYRLPMQEGSTWDWKGTIGTVAAQVDSRVAEVADTEVSGRVFADCAHLVSDLTYETADGQPVAERIEEWVCPDVGPVRVTDTVESMDVAITEELVAFHGESGDWTAAGLGDLAAEPALQPPAADAAPVPGSTVGLDAARSNATEGRLGDALAWSDLRALDGMHPPVSDGRTMVVGEEDGELTATALGSGEVRWRVRLAGPVVAPPTVAGGAALVTDSRKQLWALDLDDGSARWVHRFDDVVPVSPVVVGDTVVVLTDDGRASALGLADGVLRWQRELGVRPRSAPALAVPEGTDPGAGLVVVGDPAGELVALEVGDGSTAWSEELESALVSGPAVHDGSVLAADDGGIVYAVDAADGDVRWETRTRFDPTGAFAVADGLAVVRGGPERLEAFAVADGVREWSVRVPETSQAPVVVGDEVVTVGEHGEVRTLALATGAERGSFRVPVPEDHDRLSVDVPVGLVGEHLVVAGETGAESSGVTLWAYPVAEAAARRGVAFRPEIRVLPASPNGQPVLDGESLYVPAMDNTLYRSTGLEDAQPVHTSEGLQPGIALHDGLLLAQRDAELVAYGLDDGEERWRFPTSDPYPGSVPAAAGDTVFVPVHGVGLAAVGTDGTPRWFTRIQQALTSTSPLPLPGGDVVYGSGLVARYDGATGDRVWAAPDLQMFGPLAQADGLVFADALTLAGTTGLHALDAETGEVRWVHDNPWTEVLVGPAAADGVVVLADGRGLVVGLDTATGEQRWRVQMTSPPAGSPVIEDGRVYLAEQGRQEDIFQREYRISAHDLQTGELLGSFQPPGQDYVLTPAFGASGGRLMVPSVSFRGHLIMMLEVQG